MGKPGRLRRIALPLVWIAVALAPARSTREKVTLTKEQRRQVAREAAWDVNKYGLWLAAVVAVPLAAIAATMPFEVALRAIGLSEDTSLWLSLIPGLFLLVVGWFYLGRIAVRSTRKDFL